MYQDIFHTQATIYRDGDEGYRVSNGLMEINNPEKPAYVQQLDPNASVPHITLLYNNFYGTKDRFTDTLGGQTYADTILVDHLHKRMYVNFSSGTLDWNGAIDGAMAFTLSGYEDWFLPTINEIMSLFDYETEDVTIGGVTLATSMKSSTTRGAGSSQSHTFVYTTVTNLFGVTTAIKTTTTTSHLAVRIFSESEL